jgi:hypothetical protein
MQVVLAEVVLDRRHFALGTRDFTMGRDAVPPKRRHHFMFHRAPT